MLVIPIRMLFSTIFSYSFALASKANLQEIFATLLKCKCDQLFLLSSYRKILI